MKLLLYIGFLLLGTVVFSQKKVIDHTAYAEWKSFSDFQLSPDGNYFAFSTKPYEGNGAAYLLSIENNVDTLLKIERGSKVQFSRKNSFLILRKEPDYKQLRSLKIKDTKSYKLPKDTLIIYGLRSKKQLTIPNVDDFELLDSLDVVVGLLTHNFKTKDNDISKGKNKKIKNGYDGDEHTFFITKENEGIVWQKTGIVDFYIDKEQQFAMLVTAGSKKGEEFSSVIRLDLKTFDTHPIKDRFEFIESMYLSSKQQAGFLIGKSFGKKQKTNELYLFSGSFSAIDSIGMKQLLDSNFILAANSGFEQLEQTDKWLLDIQRKEPEKEKDTLLKEEQVKLDIWSWNDVNLQPEQLLSSGRFYKEFFTSVFDLKNKKLVKIEDDTLQIIRTWDKSSFALAASSIAYDTNKTFDYPWRSDVYLIDLRDGSKKLAVKGNFSDILFTPDGKFVVYENDKDTNLYLRNLSGQTEKCITCPIEERWLEDLNGMDYIPGFAGRMELDENKNTIWFNSTKALYSFQFATGELSRITPEEWLNRKIELNYYKIESDSAYFNPENIIISVFDLESKFNTYYALDKNYNLKEILSGYFEARNFIYDKTHKRYFARIQNNELYPNFYLVENNQYKQLTDINPQQKNYNWSIVEPVKWTAYDGQELEGLLYKPEDYDSTKKYPLLVYYYETSSEDIHLHSTPRPTASIIFPTEYASSGYFVLMPDIRYEIGYPAKGAYNAIMSGTDHVLELYPSIDSTRMGLQGQSWGGYQTAQMVTMTTRYAAAMAGAPVSNMFSAYGGIRWGSGISRQFQYEHSQSRIGQTIWEAPELYVENSPLFGLDEVKTPLLIMHNDEDGAVPWYQGIELFMGLRRLQQPVWLLNYNGDGHNLMKKGNRKDLSRRMKQFFDFYLNNGSKPSWMEKGIPAHEKGKNFGF